MVSPLANLGVPGEKDESSWFSRLDRVKGNAEIFKIDQERMDGQFGESRLPESRQFPPTVYSRMMLTRMILSALVDADRLDAEYFTTGSASRRERAVLDSVKQSLGSEAMAKQKAPSMPKLIESAQSTSAGLFEANLAKISELVSRIEHHDQQFFDNPNKTPLDVARCDILRQCIEKGENPAFGRGIYTLTAPTGSGKTNASITFALEHAKTNHLERVIYVIPYMSIIDQTAQSFGRIFDGDDVLPHYSEADSVLRGSPYPATLLDNVEMRIRAERDVPPDKAAIIKAYYLRLSRLRPIIANDEVANQKFKEVLQVDINEDSDYVPYVLGRMFSVYEQIQKAANPNINTTIKDKYFNSAAATPSRIFGILGELSAKHLKKSSMNPGARVNLTKELERLSIRIGDRYPDRLSLPEQGAFQLGYYFEDQAQYRPKKNND